MAEAVAGLARDDGHVVGERRVVHGMHPGRDARAGGRITRQGGDQFGMGALLAHRSAVFAVQRDVEHAVAEFGSHLGLQGQALAHAGLDAAVVVADRQHHGPGLCFEQGLRRMDEGRGGVCVGSQGHAERCATMKRRGKASSRRPSARTA